MLTVRRRPSFTLAPVGRHLIHLVALLAVLALSAPAALAQQPQDASSAPSVPDSPGAPASSPADPPSRIARLSVVDGNVSFEPAGSSQFTPAELNDPLTTGDRLWTDNNTDAELQADLLAVRVGEDTDLTVTAITDILAQFGLGQGSVHLRTVSLDPGTTTELDTPNIAITVLQPGDVRVDVDPNSISTTVSVLSGSIQIDGNGFQQQVEAGQRIRLDGLNPVTAKWLQPASNDGLDAFSLDRDQAYQADAAVGADYVSPDTVGGAELSDYGEWDDNTDFGAVWFPSAVAVGWQPYLNGRWIWCAPWGWTWVEAEPWGFAPFHYGRWAHFGGQNGGRWGWVPGPPVKHPVYSPGNVAFVRARSGVTAWVPLAPHEAYTPWYSASTLYRNRVNGTRLPSHATAHNDATRDSDMADASTPQLVNRSLATVAVPQEAFAAGRSARSSEIHLPAAEIASAEMLSRPLATPQRPAVAAWATAVRPPHATRPVLASRDQIPAQGEAAPIERRGFVDRRGFAVANQPAHSGEAAQPAEPARNSFRVASPDASPDSPTRGPVHGTEALPAGRTADPAQTTQPARTFYNRSEPSVQPPAPERVPERPVPEQQREAAPVVEPLRPLNEQPLSTPGETHPAPEQRPNSAPAPRMNSAPAPRSEPAPRMNSAPASRSSSPSASSSEAKH